jgi:hypothetical protein
MQAAEFDTHAGFVLALQGLVQAALERRLRRLVLVDPSFADWPLESALLLDPLTAFVRLPGRQVLLLGRGFEGLRRSSPRFVTWRRTWAHAVQAARPEDDELELPTCVLADRSLGLWVREREKWSGVLRVDEPDVARWALETDALTQRARPDFPPYILGL